MRRMIIFPEMVGIKFGIYTGGGKEGDSQAKWFSLTVKPEMVGKRLGDFAVSVKRVQHSAPGIGASKGSKHIAVK
jgi:small subunit ribosomal protein S19